MEFSSLQRVSLAVAQERSVDAVLTAIVEGLAAEPSTALARIWLIRPGDICESCHLRAECPDQTQCLHLVAGQGRSEADPGADWSRLDGDFRRFPLGIRKVGKIGATGEPELLAVETPEEPWIARPEWALAENIRSFAGQPLIFQGKVLGVLAVFCRRSLCASDELEWLGVFANQAAVALSNARAFEEIEALRKEKESENEYLRRELRDSQAFGDIVGDSSGIRKVLEQVDLVADTDASVLILGETGTGKELVARAIHEKSRRADGAFIKVNCAAIPRDLFESEFFGHVKGAFTGAVKDRVGRFELANRGTLFLDEVGEIPLELQSKLLRVLQEGTFERVGEARTRKVDVRIITATHRDLRADPSTFRQDLYFRLSVFPIDVLPLRERPDDIPLLAEHFLAHFSGARDAPRLSPDQAKELMSQDWPGNIRELQNAIERALILSKGGALRLNLQDRSTADSSPSPPLSEADPCGPSARILTDDEIREMERSNTVAALESVRWRIRGEDGAARVLGIKPTTLAARMKKMGIRRPIT